MPKAKGAQGWRIGNFGGSIHFTSSGFSFNLTTRRNSLAVGSGTGYSPSA
jgi:hypothetical protein